MHQGISHRFFFSIALDFAEKVSRFGTFHLGTTNMDNNYIILDIFRRSKVVRRDIFLNISNFTAIAPQLKIGKLQFPFFFVPDIYVLA